MINIIPAIDIIAGQCVRLTQGDYEQKKVYNEDPLAMAREFEAAGIKNLHLVDLDGAKAQDVVNLPVLERIVLETSLKVDFGGGVKTDEAIQKVFKAGAFQVTGGSIAVKSPETFSRWLGKYGPERLILGADVKNGKVAINGWQEESTLELTAFLEDYVEKGVRYVICTDVSKDGMLEGPAVALYKDIIRQFPDLKLIASGGVSNMEDIKILSEEGLYGVIVGKAIYEGRITLEEINQMIG